LAARRASFGSADQLVSPADNLAGPAAACSYGADAQTYGMAVGALGARSCEKEALAQLLEVRKRVPGYKQQDGVLAEEMALQVGQQGASAGWGGLGGRGGAGCLHAPACSAATAAASSRLSAGRRSQSETWWWCVESRALMEGAPRARAPVPG
jgi:hypothetical protein